MFSRPRSPGNLIHSLLLVGIAAGCSSSGAAPAESPSGRGGAPGQGGAPASSHNGSGGSSGNGGASNSSSGGAGGSPGLGGTSGSAPDGSGTSGAGGNITGPGPDASAGPVADARSSGSDSSTPMSTDGGPAPSYEGEIPIHYGPEVGPIVQMNCPEDPTVGWTEYQDSFHIERPHNVPVNTRFSITGGIYNFWVFPNDRPHSPIAMGRNPRTEATYGGTHDKANVAGGSGISAKIGYFKTGMRMYSADMLIEGNAVGSAIMQIHTTASGGGPIGLRINGGNMVNNGSLTVVRGDTVPGGLVNKWFNYKASLDTATLEVKIYINNCLKSTYRGPRGDGNFYFKNGVYFCKTSQNGCFTHYKNIHLYKK